MAGLHLLLRLISKHVYPESFITAVCLTRNRLVISQISSRMKISYGFNAGALGAPPRKICLSCVKLVNQGHRAASRRIALPGSDVLSGWEACQSRSERKDAARTSKRQAAPRSVRSASSATVLRSCAAPPPCTATACVWISDYGGNSCRFVPTECRICTGCTDDNSTGWRSARILRGLTSPCLCSVPPISSLSFCNGFTEAPGRISTLTGAPGDPEGVAENQSATAGQWWRSLFRRHDSRSSE